MSRVSARDWFQRRLDWLSALFFGEKGPDLLIGALVRATPEEQALISKVYQDRLAYGPEGAREDFHSPERAAWRAERRWKLEGAWALIVLLQDRPGLVFGNLLLMGVVLVAWVNTAVSWVAGWFQ